MSGNVDQRVVEDFGREWTRFDQSGAPRAELAEAFESYFAIFPWADLPRDAEGFDLGCGSGRWARLVAPRVGTLHCMDASEGALAIARRNLREASNCVFHSASVDRMPLADASMDFGYSLGVLHHVPNTEDGIRSCAAALKPRAPLLLYLYYAFDNKPWWYKLIWKASDVVRRGISRSPYLVKLAASQILAGAVYYPLARSARLLERRGVDVANLPLSIYRDKSFYTMRTDSLDRFGTRLEHRFTRDEIEAMMSAAGLTDIAFSDRPPFWCAVGYKA